MQQYILGSEIQWLFTFRHILLLNSLLCSLDIKKYIHSYRNGLKITIVA